MLSRSTSTRLDVPAGATGSIEIEVTNLRDVIDGIAPRVHGLDPRYYDFPVPYVSVFPDATEVIRVEVNLPRWFPAGEHDIVVELRSTVDGEASVDHPITLVVAPIEDVSIRLQPRAHTGGSKASFDVELINKGNTVVDLVVDAADSERLMAVSADPIFVRVPNGSSTHSTITAKKRRPFFGSPVRRTITVTAENSETQLLETFQLTQKARLPTGLGTIFVLTAIIALWAFVFTWAISNVFATDAGTKAVGAGFAAGGPESIDIAGVTGSIDGLIVNAAGEGIPRLTVSAIRAGSDDPAIASVATDDSGAFSLPLLPGSYEIMVGGEGYATVPFQSDAIDVAPSAPTDAGELQLAGRGGTIRGRILVELEDGAPPPEYDVEVRPVVDDIVGPEIDVTPQIDPDGGYVLTGLPTPADYQLTLLAANFAPRTLVTTLEGGADIIVNTLQLGAGSGRIEGLVLGDSGPLGNVAVTLTAGEDAFELTTPTTGGDVGEYVFEGLVSPRTYLLTFERDGYSTESIALQLGPGDTFTVDDLTMERGTGEISGTVRDENGGLLPGVTVTVTGADTSVTVQTLTADAIGEYRIEGLATPGTYAVTYSLEGFTDITQVVSLADRGVRTGLDAELDIATATISGIAHLGVSDTPSGEISVVASNGRISRSTVSVSAVTDGRNYILTDLEPGVYTVTFSDDTQSYTLLVGTVGPGAVLEGQNGFLRPDTPVVTP